MNKLSASVAAFRASTAICFVTIFAMATASCTSTGSAPTAGSVLNVASATTSTATASADPHAIPAAGSEKTSPEALALAGGTETNAAKAATQAAAAEAQGKTVAGHPQSPKEAAAAQQAAKATAETGQHVTAFAPAAVKPPVKTSLFGSAAPETAEQPQAAEAHAAPETGAKPTKADAETKAAQAASGEAGQTIAVPDAKPAVHAPASGKDNGLLMRLFANNAGASASKRQVAVIQPKAQAQLKAISGNAAGQVASAGGLPSPSNYKPTEHLSSLPGVRPNGGIQIMQRDSLYQDDDESAAAPVILASAAGLARLAPNGLKVQRESVDVACLKPQLVGMLKTIERRFGKSVIVTSGYRSPPYNRLVNGAKASLHMSCAAADIQVPGVSKWDLANFARTMPGRGGVGTYCYTESVHVDIGPTRDWNWRCGSRRG